MRPFSDGVSHKSTVNIVEALAKSPLGFNVVDFEADVGRYPAIDLEVVPTVPPRVRSIPARLNRAQIVA